MSGELIDIYNSAGEKTGTVERSKAHGDNTLLHRAAHVFVFSSDGRLLLQKRAVTKRIQPGKWDASVGGHLGAGEDYLTGARRELAEELGMPKSDIFILQSLQNKITDHPTVVRMHIGSVGIENTHDFGIQIILHAVTGKKRFRAAFSFIIAGTDPHGIDISPVRFHLRMNCGIAIDF